MRGTDLNTYTPVSNTFEDSWSEELPLVTNTGRYDRVDFEDYDTNFSSYSLPSSELFDSPLLNLSSVETLAVHDRADLMQQTPMSGRTILPFRTQDSSLERLPSNATQRSTGMWSGKTPSVASSTRFLPTSESTLTTHSAVSPKITWSPHLWNEPFMSSGARRAQERVDELGTRQAGMLIRRFRQPSSGMDTENKNMWLSTNSLDKLELNTCSDGVTDTPCPSKRRVQPVCLAPRKSGSPLTWTREIGIQVPPNRKRKHYFDD